MFKQPEAFSIDPYLLLDLLPHNLSGISVNLLILLLDKIRQFTPEPIRIISQGEYVARSLRDYFCLLYTSCPHYGKTPPCADLIIEKRIPKVVIGCIDPFSQVAGRGSEKLRKAGIEVTVGVLEEECRHLIRRFITFNTDVYKRQAPHVPWLQSL